MKGVMVKTSGMTNKKTGYDWEKVESSALGIREE
jgi:hypothetical protein